MASVHGREERAGNNYAQEDAPCPLWCLWEAETVPDHVPVCAVGPVCVPVQIPAGGSVGYPVHLFLCVFLKDLSPIYETREHWTCDPLPTKVWFFLLLQSSLRVHILKTEKQKSLY
ncbi:uncharacterized protein LOC144928566 isoform X1 [Branchiostoma floridae x Branchiostoma belcheri]